jgi:WD40 repeat protein
MEAEDFSLFGLLGRSWELEAPVIEVAFDNNQGAVAFVLADGSVAIARIKDAEPAAKRIRISAEDGRSSILPRSKPLPPVARFTVQDNGPAAITAYGKHGFVLGDASGALFSVTPGGERTPFAKSALDGPITRIDHAIETSRVAAATGGNRVALISPGASEPFALDHGSAACVLRFSPDGDVLAIASEIALTLWAVGDVADKTAEISIGGKPLAMAWSPGRSRLAIGFESGGVGVFHPGDGHLITLPDYPSPVRALAWSPEGDILATSGAFRIIAWPMGDIKMNGASPTPTSLETGKPSLVTIEAIAAHPTRPLVAAGYENGMVIITELGKQDELVIKTEGQGAVSSIAWSKDGGYLALGSNRGLAAIVELPTQLFK